MDGTEEQLLAEMGWAEVNLLFYFGLYGDCGLILVLGNDLLDLISKIDKERLSRSNPFLLCLVLQLEDDFWDKAVDIGRLNRTNIRRRKTNIFCILNKGEHGKKKKVLLIFEGILHFLDFGQYLINHEP